MGKAWDIRHPVDMPREGHHMSAVLNVPDYVVNKKAIAWIQEVADLCEPDSVYWCNGTDDEYDYLCDQMVRAARSGN